jgi:ribosomal protein S18 acetylase RimI-like enzyme
MKTQFRKAITPAEIRSLVIFDRKVFHDYPADCFDRAQWLDYESWWMIIDGRKIGCCAFQLHADFQDDLREDRDNPPCRGSLYIATTGILPSFRGQGFGQLLKCWQIAYARHYGYERVTTNSRESNTPMIALNKKFGFRVLRTTPDYYVDPSEPTVVMELLLDETK